MAYRAYSKKNNLMISLEQWQLNRMEENPFCPVCDEIINIKAKGSILKNTHFAHGGKSKCPTIESNHERYALLSPRERDLTNGNKLKDWVKGNAHHLYLKCKEVAGFIKLKEFEEMLLKANEQDIWYYKGLTTQYLPYVLLINYGVFKKIPERNEKMYFIFAKDVQGDDMFIKKQVSMIWRIKPKNEIIDAIKIDYDVKGTAKDYFWDYIKIFSL